MSESPAASARRQPRDAAATMSLIAHLTELRNRIAKALLALLVATAFSFWWYEHGLGEFIRAPYCGLPAELRYGGTDSGGCGLLITDVFGGVFIRLKVAFLAGAVLSAPFWLYQLWAFITPGLKRNEKRYGVGFVAVSIAALRLGAVTGLHLPGQGPGAAAHPGRRRRGLRADRAGLHRLRAVACSWRSGSASRCR